MYVRTDAQTNERTKGRRDKRATSREPVPSDLLSASCIARNKARLNGQLLSSLLKTGTRQPAAAAAAACSTVLSPAGRVHYEKERQNQWPTPVEALLVVVVPPPPPPP